MSYVRHMNGRESVITKNYFIQEKYEQVKRR